MEEPTTTFADLGLRDELVAELASLGYEEPTPIQREAIPHLVAGRDVLGQAATGTGKTAAFALPILERIEQKGDRVAPMALVLVPTRELAMQVSEAVHRYGRGLGVRVVPIYGGQPINRQMQTLHRGVDVVVATPGRALDHVARKTLRLDRLQVVVLDEADEMLDMGFAEDIESLLDATPDTRQTVLFSATMPPRIDSITRRHLREPIRIEIERVTSPAGDSPLVQQRAYLVQRAHKPAALGRVLDIESPTAALVFCRTREEVDSLTNTLNGRGYRAEALHGGMDQAQRERVMGRLRAGTADLLVATDVAARGLDLEQLSHVVNFDVPSSPDAYIHRIGRVGRAGREGVAITLAEPREHRMLKAIERVMRQKIAIETLPTVADLRARRLELTRAMLQESLVSDGDLESFSVVVESLAEEFDLMDIARAAVKLAHQATGAADDDEDIPEITDAREAKGTSKPRKLAGAPQAGRTRLWIGAGRQARMRPNDLVGAIANETSLSGRDIGPIEITDTYSLVEVPADKADEVIAAIKASTIKGRKQTIRRDRA